jgi:hypothetical protein
LEKPRLYHLQAAFKDYYVKAEARKKALPAAE